MFIVSGGDEINSHRHRVICAAVISRMCCRTMDLYCWFCAWDVYTKCCYEDWELHMP